jgi:hypothetical protein
VYRVASESRDNSPIGVLREMVLGALQDLGEGRWLPWNSLQGYLAADARIAGIERLLRRWGERAGVEAPDPLEVTRRIALESLPTLGILDLGGVQDEGDLTVRLTPRGRALLTAAAIPFDATPSKFVDSQALRVGPSARVASVLGLAPFAELGRVGDALDLLLTPPSLARALSAGLESDVLRARIESVAPLPETISRMLVQASVVIGRGSLVTTSGFLWIEDPEIRELLRTRKPASEMFLDPSPPAGLLVAADVDADKLVRRCRALGVEVEIEGGTARARSMTPTSSGETPKATTTQRRVKTPYPKAR